MVIKLTVEHDPYHPICVQLIEELSAELGAIYNSDGKGAFDLQDVMLPRAAFIVAWLDDEAVGCGALRPTEDEHIAEVKRMFVRSTARGRGISRLVLQKLETIAQAFGYKHLILETGNRQREAIGLYETSGYQRMDCYGIYTNNPISICYQKQLDLLLNAQNLR